MSTSDLPTNEPGTMVRSEERVSFSTYARPTTRVRVSKRVVTEYVTQTVPVRREELVVEEEPLDPDDQLTLPALPAPGQGFDLVLHEERVVVTTEVVPVERVHVGVHTVAGETTVSADLRSEQVDLVTRRS